MVLLLCCWLIVSSAILSQEGCDPSCLCATGDGIPKAAPFDGAVWRGGSRLPGSGGKAVGLDGHGRCGFRPSDVATISMYRDRLPTAIVAPYTLSTYHLLAKMNLFDQSIRRSTNRMLLLLVYTLLTKPCFVPMVSAGEDQAPDTRRCIKNCFLDVGIGHF